MMGFLECSRLGWGVFAVQAIIVFREEWQRDPLVVRWLLDFDGNGSTYELEIELKRERQSQHDMLEGKAWVRTTPSSLLLPLSAMCFACSAPPFPILWICSTRPNAALPQTPMKPHQISHVPLWPTLDTPRAGPPPDQPHHMLLSGVALPLDEEGNAD
jgi:hypothetical protein